jgi:hypothetical protein
MHTFTDCKLREGSPHNRLGKCLVVFVPIMNKVIANLFPEEIAINDWLINLLLSMFGGTALFRVEVYVLLNATCSLKWRDVCVEIGLEEKWDAGMICQERALKKRPRYNPLTIHWRERCYGMLGAHSKTCSDSPIV